MRRFRGPVAFAVAVAAFAQPASAQSGGTILGTITGIAGPIANICAAVWREGATWATYQGSSDANGHYNIGDIEPGNYRLQFIDCNDPAHYLSEWYPHQPDSGSADVITLAAGDIFRVDTALTLGGSIAGRVTDAGGQPLANICVDTQGPDGRPTGSQYTDLGGGYVITPLHDGEYSVHFSDCRGLEYTDQWFPNSETIATAARVRVTLGSITAGIDAILLPRPRPDLAITSLRVESSPVETDFGSLPVDFSRRIQIEVTNVGDVSTTPAGRIVVWVETAPSSRPHPISSSSLTLEPGEVAICDFTWRPVGIAGDVWVYAHAVHSDDGDRDNDLRRQHHYVLVGGIGVGVAGDVELQTIDANCR